ncbi:MAG: DUF4474 domain-containing protein [Bacilli bacterium]|jgi:hypothetical protein|nr:DUF4474 domain-containing protein [Bacilli bacterium]
MKKHLALVLLSLTTTSLFSAEGFKFGSEIKQETRTVYYTDSYALDSCFLEEFDEHSLEVSDDSLELIAKKSFSMSILDELDLVGLDNTEDTFIVRYEINYTDEENTVLLSVIIEGVEDIPIFETIPGVLTPNATNEPDIMFVIDGEFLWLSDLTESGLFDENNWFSALVNTVVNAVSTAATVVVNAVASLLKPAVRIATAVAITILGPDLAASAGAWLLNMGKDEQGIYHASFDGWQQYFGYTDFYDTVFNASTSMKYKKFPFDVNGDNQDDYIFWAWKGDYLNLGAGAELGIYKRWSYSDIIWIVDKSLAMKMTLQLNYKNINIINWEPTSKQWWITGFNHKYQNVKRDDLTASFTVTFNNLTMYNSFKQDWNSGSDKWTFPTSSGYYATYSF